MSRAHDLRLAELLAARLCHELAGPLAAIGNGVELIAEEGPEAAADAVSLVADSARRATTRLQFYRFAYGLGPSSTLAGAPPHALAECLFDGTRISLDYSEDARAQPASWQKLACNLVLVGAEALGRGGRLALAVGPAGPELEAEGELAALTAEAVAALELSAPLGELAARTVHAYFTGMLARSLGWRIALAAAEPGRLRLVVEAATEMDQAAEATGSRST
ncbi:MAG TPA: histidine phosphotransferase family protein [Stellaceae bacterium]|nr:histidine phosphotransferase family protein [Stellaceae bacterium]